MPRKRRFDAPGQFHHVMNRGVEGRPIFERPDDYRYFKMLLACAAHADRFRLHGFVLMTNHFHLLAESRDGHLSETMRRIQALYAGRFNRSRSVPRPGHLFGARFKSFLILDDAYLFTAAGYVDRNPVKAGLCRVPWEYPHGSAQRLLLSGPKAPWVSSETMDRLLEPLLSDGRSRVEAYSALYTGCDELEAVNVVDACLSAPPPNARLDLDGLLGGDYVHAREWLKRQARSATEERISTPVVHPRSIMGAVEQGRARTPDARLGRRAKVSLWRVVEVGLLRDLAGERYRAIASLVGMGRWACTNRYELHRRAMRDDIAYANVAALTARTALEHCYGPRATEIARQAVERRLS